MPTMLLGLKTTGYTRDFLPLTLRLQSLQLDVQIRSKVSLKGSGKRLRAAFSYYIHGPSTAADRSSPAFPTGRKRLSHPGFSRVEGRSEARPSIVPPATKWDSAHLRPDRRGLCLPGSEGSFTQRSPPSDDPVFLVFLRRPAASGSRGPEGPTLAFGWPPFFTPCLARRRRETSSKA